MKIVLLFVFFNFSISLTLSAQILPGENRILNYRTIGFSVPGPVHCSRYKLEIATGYINAEDSFRSRVIVTLYGDSSRIIGTVPFFGSKYTWRMMYSDYVSGQDSTFHHFSTGIIPEVDTAISRLVVVKNTDYYPDAYVFLDGSRALYDMNGQPVWYLPDIDSINNEIHMPRDIKITDRGTITVLYERLGAYEINYEGAILWRTPGNSSGFVADSELYHHEFTRLEDGNYMIAGNEILSFSSKGSVGGHNTMTSAPEQTKINDSGKASDLKLPFGTLLEYDLQGNLIWSWKSSDYFRNSDVYNRDGKSKQVRIDTHENSFYFDERNKLIYVGFRNISRILKISYPAGKVLAAYGEEFNPVAGNTGNGLFCRQHSVRLSSDNCLYMFNNNVCNKGALPEVLKFREPASGVGNLEKIWEYKCPVDNLAAGQSSPYHFTSGGNVIELPDQSLFVNMSANYSRIFIVNKNKEVLWNAIPERWNGVDNKWDMVPNYRASIITNRRDFEKLVWNGK